MALSHHDEIELMQGDDWKIPFTLLDPASHPIDLTSIDASAFTWALVGPDGIGVSAVGAVITKSAPTAGRGMITVPRAVTEGLTVGRYFDSLRVLIGSSESTFWVGTILVDADPSSV